MCKTITAYILVLVLCLLVQFNTKAQDTLQVKALVLKADSLLSKNLNESYNLSKKAFGLTKNYPNTKWYYESVLILTKVYYQKDWPDSIINLLVNVKAGLPANINKKYRGVINHRLSGAYISIVKLEAGLKTALEALSDFEAVRDSMSICNTYVNIGNIYSQQLNFKQTIKYLRKAEAIALRFKNKTPLGNVYNTLGILFAENNALDSAEKYFLASTAIREKLEDHTSVSWNYNNLGGLYVLMKKNKEAIEYLEKALKKFVEFENYDGQTSVANNLGELYLKSKDYKNALKYFSYSRTLYSKTNNPDNLENLYTNLSVYYDILGDLKTAFKYSDSLIVLKDSLYGKRLDRSMAEMQTKYETEKKEKENLELKRKSEVQELELQNESQRRKLQLIASLGFTIVVVGSIIFFYNRRKLKQKADHAREMAEAEKLRFKAIIEAEEKERSRIAVELHDGLGQMLSTARLNVAALEESVIEEDKPVLDKSLKIIDDACVEIRNISHNMMPSALIRLGLIPAIKEVVDSINSSKSLKIDFTTNVSESLGQSLDITIYRIVQEILNNMIKHARADHIDMEIKKEGNNLQISMKDNGIGFDTEALKQSKGMGWKNIFSRVSMMDGTIDLDSKPQMGTMVFINLKLKHG